ncbi:MAG: MerC domain-containing protein [Bacteroidetes bacterium]|nr:MerC domain-containing protein [Bacteroidota bacterium]HET6242953.1 MerC domain-containing protein [Bacteroidia bacterium]
MLKKTPNSDIIGILSSGLCLVHCLALPAAFLYIGDSSAGHSHGHGGFNYDYLFLSIAIVAVFFTTKKTSSTFIKFSLWIFLLICTFAIIFHDYSPFIQYIMYIGSAGLIISHVLNIRYNKQHCC